MKSNKKKLSAKQYSTLLSILKKRFEENMQRHKNIEWSAIETKFFCCRCRRKILELE